MPVRSTELNLIEVRWLWLQRQIVSNSTFKDEHEIGRTVSKWKNIYNKNHCKAITKYFTSGYTFVFTQLLTEPSKVSIKIRFLSLLNYIFLRL